MKTETFATDEFTGIGRNTASFPRVLAPTIAAP